MSWRHNKFYKWLKIVLVGGFMSITGVNMKKKRREKLRSQLTRKFVAREILPSIGMPGIPHTDVTLNCSNLNRGLDLKSKLYEVTINIKDINTPIPLIVKEHLSYKRGATRLFDSPDEEDKNTARYEIRFLRFFGKPRIMYSNESKRIVVLEKWDGSLDELLLNMISIDTTQAQVDSIIQKTKAGDYLENIAYLLVNNSRLATDRGPIFELARSNAPIKRRRKDEAFKRFSDLLSAYGRYCAGENILDGVEDRDAKLNTAIKTWETKLSEPVGEDLIKLALYLSTETEETTETEPPVRAVIHFDSRSPNVLFKKKEPNGNKSIDVEFAMCDFASVKLGPLAYDLATIVNDFYFIASGVSLDDSKRIFDKSMMLYPNLWTRASNEQDIRKQLDYEFVQASIIDAITRVGVPMLMRVKSPEKYKIAIGRYPLETIENIKRVKMGRLRDILDRYQNESFRSLRTALDEAENIGV